MEQIKIEENNSKLEPIIFEPQIQEEKEIKQIGINYDTEIIQIKKRLTILENSIMYWTDLWTTDSYSINLRWVTSYYNWLSLRFKANTANTWASTLNINNMWAQTIVKSVSTTLANNDILAWMICSVVYDGANFILLNPRTL